MAFTRKYYPAQAAFLPGEHPIAGDTTLSSAAGYAITNTSQSRNALWFDDAASVWAVWMGSLPFSYKGGGLTFSIPCGSSDTSGTLQCSIRLCSMPDSQALGSNSWTAANTGTVTVSTTAGNLKECTVTFTDGADMGSAGAGEPLLIGLSITNSSGIVGDIWCPGLWMEETV